jgi:hypothetical protein
LYLLLFFRKSTSIFVLIDPFPEVKPNKKNTQNKRKEKKRSNLTAKKTKRKSKVIQT